MELEPGDILSITHEDWGGRCGVAVMCRVDGPETRIEWITRPPEDEIFDVLMYGGYVAGLGWCEVQKVGHCDSW